MNFRYAAVFAILFAIGVPAGFGQQEDKNPAGNPQVWGGEHVSLVVSKENATLEFDCAEGVVMNPIRPDANGDFTASGTYTPQHGGPVKKDNPPADVPATYKGMIRGNTMHLQVVLADSNTQPPAMTLTRGATGHVVKCR